MGPTIGQAITSVNVFTKDEDGIDTLDMASYLADKKVVLFSVPGAFTPTCSVKHVPSYVAHKEALKAAGFDAVLCLSVNDAHVMKAWEDDQQSNEAVMMIADPEAHFSEQLGLAVHMGPVLATRATRAAIVIDKGVVTHSFMEEPGVYEVSSAEHVLANL